MQDLQAADSQHHAVADACAVLERLFGDVDGTLDAPALRRLHTKLYCHMIDSYRQALALFEGALLPAGLDRVKQDARVLRQLFAAHGALLLSEMLPRYELLKVRAGSPSAAAACFRGHSIYGG